MTRRAADMRGLEILPERLWSAVRAGCSAADIHLMCSYPKCACRKMPLAIEAAIDKWEALRHASGEQAPPAKEG